MRRDSYTGKPDYIGYPFHGLVRNGSLILPNSQVIDVRHKTVDTDYVSNPFILSSMPSMVQRNPFATGDTRDAAVKANDLTVNGREYLDYALCPTNYRTWFGGRNIAAPILGLTGGDFGCRGWFYTDPAGQIYTFYLVIFPPSGGDDIFHPNVRCYGYDTKLEEDSDSINTVTHWIGDLPRYYAGGGDSFMRIHTFSATEDGAKAVHSIYECTKYGGVPLRISDNSPIYDFGYRPFLIHNDERSGLTLRAVITVEVSGTGTDRFGNGLTVNVTIDDFEPTQAQTIGISTNHQNTEKTQEDGSGQCVLQSGSFTVTETVWTNEEVLSRWVTPSGALKELVGTNTTKTKYGPNGTLGDQVGTADCNATAIEDRLITWGTVNKHYDIGIFTDLAIRTVGGADDWSYSYSDYPEVSGDVITADPFYAQYCNCSTDPTAPVTPNIDGWKDDALVAAFEPLMANAENGKPHVYHVNGGTVVFLPDLGQVKVWTFDQEDTVACDCSDYPKTLDLIGQLQIAADPGKGEITVEFSTDSIVYI